MTRPELTACDHDVTAECVQSATRPSVPALMHCGDMTCPNCEHRCPACMIQAG